MKLNSSFLLILLVIFCTWHKLCFNMMCTDIGCLYFWGSHSDSRWNFVTVSGSFLIIVVCTNYNDYAHQCLSQGLIVSGSWSSFLFYYVFGLPWQHLVHTCCISLTSSVTAFSQEANMEYLFIKAVCSGIILSHNY